MLLLFLSFLCELLASKSNKGVNPFPESLLSKVFGLRIIISRLSATSSLPGVCMWCMLMMLSVVNMCDLVY